MDARSRWATLEDYRLNESVALSYEARMLEKLGKKNQSLQSYSGSLTGFERALPPDHPYIDRVADQYSKLLWKDGQWVESIRRKRQANKIKREIRMKNRSDRNS